MSQSDAGKTDKRRPMLISQEEYNLRWQLLSGEVTPEEFFAKLKKLKGKN